MVGPDFSAITDDTVVTLYKNEGFGQYTYITQVVALAPDGVFSFIRDELDVGGRYVVLAYSSDLSRFTDSLPQEFVNDDGPLPSLGPIRLTYPRFRGVVVAPDGVTRPLGTGSVTAQNNIFYKHASYTEQEPFVLGGLPPGVYDLAATTPDPSTQPFYTSVPQNFVVTPDSFYEITSTEMITLRLTYPQIEGMVLLPDGTEPVAAGVEVFQEGNFLLSEYTDGVIPLRLGNLSPAVYTLVAYPDADEFATSDALDVDIPQSSPYDPGRTQYISLTLNSPQVSGVVVSPDGLVEVPAWIDLQREGEWLAGEDSSPGMPFYFGGFEPGVYTIIAYPQESGVYWASAPLTVTLGTETQFVTLTLRGPDLVGRVVAADGTTPVAYTSVNVHDHDWSIDYWSLTNQAGQFAFGGLQPGEPYSLTIVAPDFGMGFGQILSITLPSQDLPLDVGDISLRTGTAEVRGWLVDEQGQPVTDAEAVVMASEESQGHFSTTTTTSGTFSLSMVPGTWWLDYWVSSESGYIALPDGGGREVIIDQDGMIITETLTVVRATEVISGRVDVEPAGSPLPLGLVRVYAYGLPGTGGAFGALTDAEGYFTLNVPPGDYVVGAEVALEYATLYYAPLRQTISTPATDVVLRFRRIDTFAAQVFVTGTVTITPSDPGAEVFISAWSREGGYVTATVQGDNVFELSLPATTTVTSWTLWAAAENHTTGAFYESAPQLIEVQDQDLPNQMLVLTQQALTLPPRQCWSFDPRQIRYINLPSEGDLPNSVLAIPPGALSTTDTTASICAQVSLRVPGGQDRIGFIYDLEAFDAQGQLITQNFNTPLRLTFYYDDSSMTPEQERQLVPAFFSTARNEWEPLRDIIQDSASNFISGRAEHFTQLGTRNIFGTSQPTRCYNFDGDTMSTVIDVQQLAAHWGLQEGQTGWNSIYDLNGDKVIDATDITRVASTWNTTCTSGGAVR